MISGDLTACRVDWHAIDAALGSSGALGDVTRIDRYLVARVIARCAQTVVYARAGHVGLAQDARFLAVDIRDHVLRDRALALNRAVQQATRRAVP